MARQRPPVISRRTPQPTTRPRAQTWPPRPSWGRPRASAPAPRKPVGGTPAAPAPAPVAAPQYSLAALPPDASYDAAVALLARQRDEGLAALTGERSRGLLDYGFSEGPGGTLAVDPNNANSKAALLKKTYDQNRRSTGQSMASGGQLYSGAFQNAQDLVNRNEAQSSDALQKALIGFLARNTQQAAQARTGYETAAGQAFADRVGRFQSNPLYDPASAEASVAAAPAAAGRPVAASSLRSQAARLAAARKRNPRGVWGR